jgi:hypothetical protein
VPLYTQQWVYGEILARGPRAVYPLSFHVGPIFRLATSMYVTCIYAYC